MAALTQAARDHFGPSTEVRVTSGPRPVDGSVQSLATLQADSRKAASDQAREAVERHPLVQYAVQNFGAELREVRLPEGEE
jgi:hypothetical protein